MDQAEGWRGDPPLYACGWLRDVAARAWRSAGVLRAARPDALRRGDTTLEYRYGFYGLLADGWDITDFGSPWPRGRMPVDTDPAELIVGMLDLERASGARITAADINDKGNAFVVQRGGPADSIAVNEEQVARIRVRIRELHEQWRALPPGVRPSDHRCKVVNGRTRHSVAPN
jgi:hypothetical protein